MRLEGSSLLAGTQACALDGKASHTIQAEQAKNRFPSRILAEQPCSTLVSLIPENLIWTGLAAASPGCKDEHNTSVVPLGTAGLDFSRKPFCDECARLRKGFAMPARANGRIESSQRTHWSEIPTRPTFTAI